MNRTTMFFSALLFASAAQAQQTAQVQFEATTGPVTVNSMQPPIPNAADYQATVVQLDANGDGFVTRQEVPLNHALAFEFELVDTDRNGRHPRGWRLR
jgi:hypothetical protein